MIMECLELRKKWLFKPAVGPEQRRKEPEVRMVGHLSLTTSLDACLLQADQPSSVVSLHRLLLPAYHKFVEITVNAFLLS